MDELIQSTEDLIEILTQKQLCSSELRKSVNVTSKLRRIVLTDVGQGRFIHNGIFHEFNFTNLGGGVYNVTISKLKRNR